MGKKTKPRTVHNVTRSVYTAPIQDPADARIEEWMRIGPKTFRPGTPVSEVLQAARDAYNAQPLPKETIPENTKQKGFVRQVYDLLQRHAIHAQESTTPKLLQELLDAFMVTKVADLEEDDRELFLTRLKEKVNVG